MINTKKKHPALKKYGTHTFYQSKCGKYWYSRDTAGHGGSCIKKYINKGATIELICSLDEEGNEMTAKHESGKHAVIKKKDMTGIKGKEKWNVGISNVLNGYYVNKSWNITNNW